MPDPSVSAPAPPGGSRPDLPPPPPPAPASWTVRGWREGDDTLIRGLDDLAFGYTASDDHWATGSSVLERDRAVLVADPADPAAVVAGAGAYSFDVSVPGGRTVAMAGVSWVAVAPTHRRRGLLRVLMAAQLAEIAGRGEPVAMLWCSEATIYGRFGYGHASSHARISVDRHRAAIDPLLLAAAEPLQAEMRDPAASLDDVESVYEAVRRTRPGMPARSPAWQRLAVADAVADREGMSALRAVVFRDRAGTVRAAARYRVEGWAGETPDRPRRSRVGELYADGPAAAAAAWSWIGQLDLVGGYRAGTRPVDDPLLLQLSDLRAASVETDDAIWIRLVDLPAALAARGYAAAVDLVLDVADLTLPANAGRWRVRTDADGATATRTDDPADLTLDTAVLAQGYLGRAGALARAHAAGYVTEHRAGAVAELSGALDSAVEPWCPVHF